MPGHREYPSERLRRSEANGDRHSVKSNCDLHRSEKTRKRYLPWLGYDPSRYDIRKLVGDTPTMAKLDIERDTRAAILMASDNPTYRELGELLHELDDGVPLPMGHCPLNAYLFQVWSVSKALRVFADFRDMAMVTVFDRDDECEPSELGQIDWPKLHANLRARIMATMGTSVTVLAAGEVDYNDKTGLFRPHHHVFIAGYGPWSLGRFKFWYPEKGTCEVDLLPSLRERATAMSYATKNIAYLHPFEQQGPERCNFRLHPREFRPHMHYLSEHDYRDFLFCMNHRLPG
jgi:hypothetical protein